MRRRATASLVGIAIIAITSALLYQKHCAEPQPRVQQRPASPAIGTIVFAKSEGAYVPVTADQDALYDLLKALSARDQIGVDDITRTRAFSVTNNTQLLVIDRDGYGALKVRVQDGQHAGRVGWVDPSWISHQ
jgi:hypothetical protein